MKSTGPTILNEDFKAHLSVSVYCTLRIDPIIKEAINTNRAKLILKNTPKQSIRNPTVLISKLDPCQKGLNKTRIFKIWDIVHKNFECKISFDSQPIIAFSKPKKHRRQVNQVSPKINMIYSCISRWGSWPLKHSTIFSTCIYGWECLILINPTQV